MFDIIHKKVNTKPDTPDPTIVRPSDWNDKHKIVVSPGVVGRMANTGNGDPEVLPIYVDAFGVVNFDIPGALQLPRGNNAERPVAPQHGMMRFNEETGKAEAYLNNEWVEIIVGPDARIPVGTIDFTYATVAPSGWVFVQSSIGNVGSGANRSNVDTLPLYKMLWDGYPDSFATVTGGRIGAVAEEDFFANKKMQLPDLREAVLAVTGTLNGSVSNERLMNGATGGFGADVSAGKLGGSKSHVLTKAEMPTHQHKILNDITSTAPTAASVSGGAWFGNVAEYHTEDEGEDAAHNNVQPTILLNAIVKL